MCHQKPMSNIYCKNKLYILNNVMYKFVSEYKEL